MKLYLIAGGIAAGTLAVAIPTAIALAGPPSFSERVPVRVPSHAAVVSFDDHGHASEAPTTPKAGTTPATAAPVTTPSVVPTRHENEPGDDNHRNRHGHTTAPSATSSAAPTRHENEPGDDNHRNRHGGSNPTTSAPTTTATHTEPGDDHGHGSNSGHGGNSGHGSNSGHGGHGGDD